MSVTAPLVLLLEDDPADALLIEEAVGRALPAAAVVRAATWQEFTGLVASEPVDVILCDRHVPCCDEMDAYYLSRQKAPNAAFLLMSGGERRADPRVLSAMGIGGPLSKDNLDELASAVLDALPGRRPAREGVEHLLTVSRQLARAEDLPTAIALVQTAARRLTGSDGVGFTIREGDEHRYTDEFPPGPVRTGLRLDLGQALSTWVLDHRQPVVVDDTRTDDRVPAGTRDTGLRSVAVVPIGTSHPLGTLAVYWRQVHQVEANELRLLLELADCMAVAMENVQLRRALTAQARDWEAEHAALTYAVSHDLRAPIRHLEGFTQMLMDDAADLDQRTRHAALRIQHAATSLREMVNGMLVLSRISRSELNVQELDLADLARSVAQALDAAPAGGGERAGTVEVHIPEHLPATGDPRLLHTVFQDLLANAWKFTARIPSPRVEVGVQGTGDDLEYFVRDNGAGFEPAGADRLFGAFQRLHGGEDFPGVGIGLAAVKRIVAKHGGTVRATGAPDEGATFFFTLPSPRGAE